MTFFSKLFGKSKAKIAGTPEEMIQQAVDGILDHSGFQLTYELEKKEEGYLVNFVGQDGRLLTERDGLVLEAFQTYLKRVLQNRLPDQRIEVEVDCDGYLEKSAEELRQLASRLKDVVLDKGQPSYVRALQPRDRKVIHRFLAEDDRVKSQSIGDGFLKKIKIYPAQRSKPVEETQSSAGQEVTQVDADTW